MNRSRKTTGILICVSLAASVFPAVSRNAKADFVIGEAMNLGPTINSAQNDGALDISSDGLELYFGSNRPGGQGTWDLWVTTRETVNDPWGPPLNLGTPVNGSYEEGSPCITPDGLWLYFVSNRPGGQGTYDIWVSVRVTKDSQWGSPLNLGTPINSPGEEGTVSVSSDGLELYFSELATALPGGYGLCDIWMSKRASVSSPWDTPVNLGPNVNSSAHDTLPCISADGLSLYFTRFLSGGKAELWVTTRATVSDSWNRLVNLGLAAVNPSFSPNGSILYFSSTEYGGYGGSDLWEVSVSPIVDFNTDGIVDCTDVSEMIDFWGTDNTLYDIGPMPWGDGVVDAQDLLVLAEYMVNNPVDVNDVNNIQ